jgi:PPOX class probable F420-dependent enzyme
VARRAQFIEAACDTPAPSASDALARRHPQVRLTGSMTIELSEHFSRILTAPVFGHLATVRSNGSVQVNPMWFEFDGGDGVVRFTHTTKRAKFKNLQKNPHMTLEALDPANPLKYVEVRGRLAGVIPDPEGAFYVHLGRRYGNPHQQPPADKADRVILVMQVEKVAGR